MKFGQKAQDKACRYLLQALPLLLIVGCQYDPFAHQYCQERPVEADLVGTYQVVESTVKIPKTHRMWLALQEDGTYRAFHMLWRSEGNDFGLPDDEIFKGHWKVVVVGSGPGVERYWGLIFDGALAPDNWGRDGTVCHVACANPRKKLIIGFGDPDSGEAMVLSR